MMTIPKHVLVLFIFALPISTSSSLSNRTVETSSNANSKCRDSEPQWCKKMKSKFPGTFAQECGKIGGKGPNFQREVIENFCCETCKALRVKIVKAPASEETSKCNDRRGDWCSELNMKHPDTFERLCEPGW